MTKFRKWLIHKLGGVLEEEKHVVKIESFKLETITARAEGKDYIQYGENSEEYIKHIKHNLKMGLLEHIQPYYIHKYDSETDTCFFEAEIELPSIYIKREANND